MLYKKVLIQPKNRPNNSCSVPKKSDGFIPEEVYGGNNKNYSGKHINFSFYGINGLLVSDIDEKKGIIRKRTQSVIKAFYEKHDLNAGDSIFFVKKSENEFEIIPEAFFSINVNDHLEEPTKVSNDNVLTDPLAGFENETIELKAIKTRRGQPAFRKALLEVFSGKCCVTGSSVASVLEAAHIIPHVDETNYSITNGLLLRADIHTLFDLHLVSISPEGEFFISNDLYGTEYEVYKQKKVIVVDSPLLKDNLFFHYDQFKKKN